MPEDVRLWEIADGDQLKGVEKSKLDLEERLEKWSDPKDHVERKVG